MKFSIVMPVYNVAPFLEESLDSIRAQDCPDWECICVDDGSTDESGKILDRYAVLDARFIVVHQHNAGTWAARNAALERASGEWLCFVDSDDIVHSNLLSECSRAIERASDADVVRYRTLEFMGKDGFDWPCLSSQASECRDVSSHVDVLDLEGGFWSRIYRRDRIADIRFGPFKIGQDRAYFMAVMDRVCKVVELPHVLYAYRQRQGSAVNSAYSLEKAMAEIGWNLERFRVWEASKKIYSPILWRRFALHMTEWMSWRLANSDKAVRRGAREEWKRALWQIRASKNIRGWSRMAISLTLILPFQVSSFFLFEVPYNLKRMGFHR